MKKNDAIMHFGNIPTLAKALGIDRHAIYQWQEVVPEKRALQLDRLTGGKLRYQPSAYHHQA